METTLEVTSAPGCSTLGACHPTRGTALLRPAATRAMTSATSRPTLPCVLLHPSGASELLNHPGDGRGRCHRFQSAGDGSEVWSVARVAQKSLAQGRFSTRTCGARRSARAALNSSVRRQRLASGTFLAGGRSRVEALEPPHGTAAEESASLPPVLCAHLGLDAGQGV